MVQYTYDAWGNHTVTGSNTTLGDINPFRYRGYYYDTETKLYYLQTRYYDPEVGRFINMDSIDFADPSTINGLNLYAYCGNNPVMNVDPTGTNWWDQTWGAIIAPFDQFLNWFDKTISQPVTNFFNETLPTWIFGDKQQVVDTKLAIDNFFVKDIPEFFNKTVPDFFVNTVWNNWIVNTVWNDWIVDKFWNKFLVSYWHEIVDGFSALFGIGSGIATILSAAGIISIPVIGQISLAIVGIGFGIYTIGRIFVWW